MHRRTLEQLRRRHLGGVKLYPVTPVTPRLSSTCTRTPDNTDRGMILKNGGPWAPRVDDFLRFLPHIWVDGVPNIKIFAQMGGQMYLTSKKSPKMWKNT